MNRIVSCLVGLVLTRIAHRGTTAGPTCRRLGALMVWLVAGVAPVLGQGVGSIAGTVVDASGSVLPGVTVTLTLEGGGVGSGQTAVSNEQGAYQFTRLVPGTYGVKAELQGFRSVDQRSISVNSDQVSRADFKLEIGTVEESITVSGQSPLLDTSTSLRQTVITARSA